MITKSIISFSFCPFFVRGKKRKNHRITALSFLFDENKREGEKERREREMSEEKKHRN